MIPTKHRLTKVEFYITFSICPTEESDNLNELEFVHQLLNRESFKEEYVSLKRFIAQIEQLEKGIFISGNGLMIEPYIFTDRPVSGFPYIFFAQKLDQEDHSLDEPGELEISPWFKELAEASYFSLDSALPILKKKHFLQYLDYLESNYIQRDKFNKDMKGYSRDNVYLKVTAF